MSGKTGSRHNITTTPGSSSLTIDIKLNTIVIKIRKLRGNIELGKRKGKHARERKARSSNRRGTP